MENGMQVVDVDDDENDDDDVVNIMEEQPQYDQVISGGRGRGAVEVIDMEEQQQQRHLQQHDEAADMDGDDDDDILEFDDTGQHQQQPSHLDGGAGGGMAMMDDGVLLMRFCPNDSSMLYPQEDKRTRTLRYACRLCHYSEGTEGTLPLIYRNRRKREVMNVLQTVPSSISDDPTLPRSYNISCVNCGHNEAVFFQSDTSDVRADSLALIFVCCNCDYKWVG